jgi:hypothetical protein
MPRARLDVRLRIVRSATEYCRAVAGMSCISPMAPLGDRARRSYADSTWMTARTSVASTPCRAATLSMIGS